MRKSLILSLLLSALTLGNVSFASTPIGSYSNGCIKDSQALNLKHPYYQVLRTQTRRFYADKTMINFIDRLAIKTHEQNLPILLIGDTSLKYGGRFQHSNHASHQMGLDVDIWFKMVNKPLTQKELKSPTAISVVAPNFLEVNKNYTPQIYTLIKTAALDTEVDRIFVNPAIKERLCLDAPENDRMWLHKVRPWWGHNAHMHVRLKCPEGNSLCQTQAPIPSSGDGCGMEVTSWLDEIRFPKPKKPGAKVKPKKLPDPPIECVELFKAHKVKK